MNNIEIGIDLGTTNSEIAIISGSQTQIIKNTYGDEFTPSVFGVNKAKDEEVGKKPYQRYFKDATKDELANNKPEVKRLMGSDEKVQFMRINKAYNAEEISSKILLALKQDALRKNPNINTSAAVITIPAHFSTTQAEATKRAGKLAGFNYVVLLQEPIAAAISYGFGKAQNENWLVYDLGGGTFDAALISCRDGNLKVLGHSGDNFLGGKDIDSKIVDEIILPELAKKYDVANFSNDKTNLAKLKYAAEQAKIQLSSLNETNIEVDIRSGDDEIYENIPITREKLKQILFPLIEKTMNLCQNTIDEAGIKSQAVDKIVLVGGPTQLPFIKECLENRFGINVDTSSDPLTAVARGACIYAMGQSIPKEFLQSKEVDENTYELELNYDSLTSEKDEFITGQVSALKSAKDDYFIQIQSEDNSFNTSKIKLKEGKFSASVVVKPNCLNIYFVYLFDKDGNILSTTLDTFSITQGLSVSGAPLPRSIGVAVSVLDLNTGKFKQSYEKFFEKNAILPLEKTQNFKTIKSIKNGDSENSLPITIYEGESTTPQNNLFICELALTGAMLGADLYEGSAVDITIKVNESREVFLEAYIPALDKSFDIRATIYDENISVENLEKTLNKEVQSLNKVLPNCSNDEQKQIQSQINELKRTLQNAKNDEDEKRKANSKIKEFQRNAEKIQLEKSSQNLKDEYLQLESEACELLENYNGSKKVDFQKRLDAIKADAQNALQCNNTGLLANSKEHLLGLMSEILLQDDSFWIATFENLCENEAFNSNARARNLINKGQDAIQNDNIAELKRCVSELVALLPSNARAEFDAKISGITR